MTLKELYNKEIKINTEFGVDYVDKESTVNPKGDATSPKGRHNAPDESYNNWPGWMSGDFHFQGNNDATTLNIDGKPFFEGTPTKLSDFDGDGNATSPSGDITLLMTVMRIILVG